MAWWTHGTYLCVCPRTKHRFAVRWASRAMASHLWRSSIRKSVVKVGSGKDNKGMPGLWFSLLLIVIKDVLLTIRSNENHNPGHSSIYFRR